MVVEPKNGPPGLRDAGSTRLARTAVVLSAVGAVLGLLHVKNALFGEDVLGVRFTDSFWFGVAATSILAGLGGAAAGVVSARTRVGRADKRTVVGCLLGLAVLACWAVAGVWFAFTVFKALTTIGPAG